MALMAKITTHVLDTSRGVPGRGVAWTLVDEDDGAELASGSTDGDGRALVSEALAPGRYCLRFAVGDYFGEPQSVRFLDVVPVSFGFAEGEHYHVPLLVSPFGYTTYRGS